MNNIFKIKNLYCSYDKLNFVLHINNLNIERGKLYFVIGQSGIGKSTFIETLGIMNNTIHSRSEQFDIFSTTDKQYTSILNLWGNTDDTISKLRRNSFSFIFQNTNLMPHFTAGENMCFTLLMEGMSFESAKKEVLKIMSELDLEEEIFDRKVQNLSGGQKQRLSFVRAFIVDFEVLFGDEPTGNLDTNTSAKLMMILKENLIKKQKTGIIVSHDINLATKYGDEIYFIKQESIDGRNHYGYLDQKQCIFKQDGLWFLPNGKNLTNPNQFLNKIIKNL